MSASRRDSSAGPSSPGETVVASPGSPHLSRTGTLSHSASKTHGGDSPAARNAKYEYSTKRGGPSKKGQIVFLEDLAEEQSNLEKAHHHFGYNRPLKLRHIIKRPVVRQWIQGGKIYRERGRLNIDSIIKLFFDLIFVGVIYNLAKSIQNFNVITVATLTLVLFPAFSMWQEVRSYINAHGTDDIIQRLYILLNMLCLLGYTANAAAIHFIPGQALQSGYNLPTLRAALLFYYASKLARLLLAVFCIRYLPRFRRAIATGTIISLFIIVPLVPLIFITDNPRLFWALMSVGLAFEMFGRFAFFLVRRSVNANAEKWEGYRAPAVNIEHHVERVKAFVILFLGEAVLSITYTADESNIGFNGKTYGRASLGLMSAFLVCWLMFDLESHHLFVHAMRRHWATGLLWNVCHFPMVVAFTCASKALEVFVEEQDVEKPIRWFWSGGIGVTLFCCAALSSLSKPLEVATGRVSHSGRCFARVLGGIIIICLPLSATLSSALKTLACTVAVLAFLVFFDVSTKLGITACPKLAKQYSGSLVVPVGFDGETESQAELADVMFEKERLAEKQERLEQQVHAQDLTNALRKVECKRLCTRGKGVEAAAAECAA